MASHYDSDRPNVSFEAMPSGLIEKDLWSNVVWRSTDCPTANQPLSRISRSSASLLTLAWKFDQGSETEVANFEVHLGIEHQIAQLQISMNDGVCVHVLGSANKLREIVACLRFREALAPA